MTDRRLLLLSNSRNYGQGYLDHAEAQIKAFLGGGVRRVLFIPFAAVRYSFGQFAETVRERFEQFGYGLDSIHASAEARQAVAEAEAIVVGGGNTFHLLHQFYKHNLLEAIRGRVNAGVPYIGWSAGSNVACRTIKTTNDMSIIEPPSFPPLRPLPL